MRCGTRVVAILSISAAVAGCKEEAAVPQPVRPVLTALMTSVQTEAGSIIGTVEPRFKTDLGFRVQGRLIARRVHIGDAVSEGQIVAAIDPTSLELALRAVVANVASNQAKLTNAVGFEDRQRTLLKTQVISQSDMDAAEQSTASARTALVRAEAELTKAREQLGYAQLKAEFAGVVIGVSAEVGQVVPQGQTVVTVARSDIREAVVDIADDVAGTLQIGQPFTVSLQFDPAIRAEGKVREIAPQADAVTRSRRVRITLDNPSSTFRLGTNVATAVISSRPVLRLPVSAIFARNAKTFVWLVDARSATVKMQEISAVPDDNGGMRIIAGVDAGSLVVTAGVHSLTEGQKIRIEQEARP